ncbi:hypothetical protein G7046_g673 [Stylonectria norvegica]|nr:hypothetical protein G7046_g673 [Stylonectria norvegica]
MKPTTGVIDHRPPQFSCRPIAPSRALAPLNYRTNFPPGLDAPVAVSRLPSFIHLTPTLRHLPPAFQVLHLDINDILRTSRVASPCFPTSTQVTKDIAIARRLSPALASLCLVCRRARYSDPQPDR